MRAGPRPPAAGPRRRADRDDVGGLRVRHRGEGARRPGRHLRRARPRSPHAGQDRDPERHPAVRVRPG